MSQNVPNDPDNPEWTDADFARAKSPSTLPDHVLAAFPNTPGAAAARTRLSNLAAAGQAILRQGAGARLSSLAA